MARFSVRRVRFGHQADHDDENNEGLPTPARVKLATRRAAGIAEAKSILEYMPGPGESLHALCTARMDLTDVITALLERFGRCDRLAIATLGYNVRNVRSMLAWMDNGLVGELTLLASIFFRSHKGDLWEETLAQFRERGSGRRAATATPRLWRWSSPAASGSASKAAQTCAETDRPRSNLP